MQIDGDDNENISQGIVQESTTVAIGDDDRQISVKLVQDIFNEITTKNTAITESFTKSYQIEFRDIEQLYHKIQQTLAQFYVISQNFSTIIYYVNNQKDELNSFEQLATLNAGSISQVESIFIKFDILIIRPATRKAQSYTISIRIASGIAMRRRYETDPLLGVPARILRMMGSKNAYSRIEYIDYPVARSIQTVISELFSVLPHAEQSLILAFIQKHSRDIPRLLRFLTVLATSLICYMEFFKVFSNVYNLHDFGQTLLCVFVIIYSSYVLSSWCGEFIENSIDSWSSLSYLKFNKGDEAEIRKYEGKNKKSLINATFGLLGTFTASIIAKVVAAFALTYLVGHGV